MLCEVQRENESQEKKARGKKVLLFIMIERSCLTLFQFSLRDRTSLLLFYVRKCLLPVSSSGGPPLSAPPPPLSSPSALIVAVFAMSPPSLLPPLPKGT